MRGIPQAENRNCNICSAADLPVTDGAALILQAMDPGGVASGQYAIMAKRPFCDEFEDTSRDGESEEDDADLQDNREEPA